MKSSTPTSVSLNGVDNIGKTTNLTWLHRGMPGAQLVGTIDAWDSRWQEVASDDFAHWWFVSSSTAEHVELVMRSHAARRAGSGTFALEDRGLPMLRAVCAATSVIKDGLALDEALALVDRIAADHLPPPGPRREVHVLLRRSAVPAHEAAEALNREVGPVGERYRAYQRALAEIMLVQVERGDYDVVLDIAETAILDVQRLLRARLQEHGLCVLSLPRASLERLWMLAGMSESGKSTVGELLRSEHGVTRLKIGYLLEIAALRAGVSDPYQAWSEVEQAERLTEEILRFAASSKARTISVESAHRFKATAHLKRVWGDRCRVVFVAADLAVRVSRAAETTAQVRERDTIKFKRGAHRVADIADHILENSGPLSALKFGVKRLVTATGLRHTVPPTGWPAKQGRWLQEATEYLRDEQTALVLATGSTGSPQWRERWSDIDLLVVRNTLPLDWLRGAVGTLPAPQGVKVGVSAFTIGDIAAFRIPPRVAQSLRRAADGFGVLYRRVDYRIPVPTRAHVDRLSRGELGLVAMTTRRLLATEHTDVRAVYKHLVLLAKILLRADGHHLDTAEDVLAAFAHHHPAAGCAPPSLDDLIRDPLDPEVGRRLTVATVRMLAYIDSLDHTARVNP
ncbi:hypothetical protein [Streptomonospora nanhaiensis]|uniref:hypothetical protein n=1 Tax=Streptomonospora nanhaiensis TaxID=1323731 RepID=UPI001C384856|nr:hypothetical protein [Streptomonospora nanhaiensis]MBV2366225.1 hypothetical protein [Streptomonospora nanhaiensis]